MTRDFFLAGGGGRGVIAIFQYFAAANFCDIIVKTVFCCWVFIFSIFRNSRLIGITIFSLFLFNFMPSTRETGQPEEMKYNYILSQCG